MPLKVPNLDDRNYSDLVEEAVAMLPRYAPEWTNHNPSDPGITLVELLAYFTELFIYRLNRITKDTKIRFLQLLVGSNGDEQEDGDAKEEVKARLAQAPLAEVDEALRQAVLALRRRQRAITRKDYEYLAQVATDQKPDKEKVLRAKAFARRNLQTSDEASRDSDAPGHMSVVVLPASELERDRLDDLLTQVRNDLEPKRLLTTRLHVVRPFYLWIALAAKIHTRPDSPEDVRARAREKAVDSLERYFNPWPHGGPQGDGWPFGRAFYLSEVLEKLEQVKGVDYMEDVHAVRMSTRGKPEGDQRTIGIQLGRCRVGIDSRLGAEEAGSVGRFVRDAAGRLVAIELRPYELIRIAARVDDLSSSGELSGDESAATQGGGK
jgi:hypothetical protein